MNQAPPVEVHFLQDRQLADRPWRAGAAAGDAGALQRDLRGDRQAASGAADRTSDARARLVRSGRTTRSTWLIAFTNAAPRSSPAEMFCALLARSWSARCRRGARGRRRGVSIGMRANTAVFPGGAGVHFDYAYYRDRHLAVMQGLYGDALTRVEMRKPLVVAGEPPSPYAAIVNFGFPILRFLPKPVPPMAQSWCRTEPTSPMVSRRFRARWCSARRANLQARYERVTGA